MIETIEDIKNELARRSYDMVAVVGPTASGKTRFAVKLARSIGGEIISGDSRQVYRGMDIGTGKDLSEYGDIRAHLIDIVPAGSKYNLHKYLRDFRDAYEDIRSRGIMPVLCGGSGMYVEGAINGLLLPEVPENRELRSSLQDKSLEELTSILASMKRLHNTTDVDTRGRAIRAIEIETYYLDHPELAASARPETSRPPTTLILAMSPDREERRKRISARLDDRLREGMIGEIKGLLDSGIPAEDLIYYGLEYKFVTLYLLGKLSYEEMHSQLETAIHQFAKRQMTWFRGMERRGQILHWIN